MIEVVKKVVKKSSEWDRATEYFYFGNPIEAANPFFHYFISSFSLLYFLIFTTFYTHLLKETIYIYLVIASNIYKNLVSSLVLKTQKTSSCESLCLSSSSSVSCSKSPRQTIHPSRWATPLFFDCLYVFGL